MVAGVLAKLEFGGSLVPVERSLNWSETSHMLLIGNLRRRKLLVVGVSPGFVAYERLRWALSDIEGVPNTTKDWMT